MISIRIYYYFLFYTCSCYITALFTGKNSTFMKVYKRENKLPKMISGNDVQMPLPDLTNMNGNYRNVIINSTKIRVKRQNSGAGKFVDAAKMPQIKLLRLLLQMFKNSWDMAYVGGTHPLHPNVPKAIVALYKQKVVEFFIPNVGEDASKQGTR